MERGVGIPLGLTGRMSEHEISIIIARGVEGNHHRHVPEIFALITYILFFCFFFPLFRRFRLQYEVQSYRPLLPSPCHETMFHKYAA